MQPAGESSRTKRMTIRDTPSALLAGALAGYLAARHGAPIVEWLANLAVLWS
jgi:hypothetical protein